MFRSSVYVAGLASVLLWNQLPALAADRAPSTPIIPEAPSRPAPTPPAAASPGGPAHPSIEVSGLLFADYSIPLGGAQAFDVTRTFMGMRGRLDDRWSATLVANAYGLNFTPGGATLPASRLEASNMVMNLAYIQGENILPGQTVQFGMILNPWQQYSFSIWPYRVVGNLPIEGGFARSAWGVGTQTDVFQQTWDKGLRWMGQYKNLAYDVAVENGEGFRAVEGNGMKTYQARVTYAITPNFEATGLFHRGNPSNVATADRLGAMLYYKNGPVHLGAEATSLYDQENAAAAVVNTQIYSAFGYYDLPLGQWKPTRDWPTTTVLGRFSQIPAAPGNPGIRSELFAGVAVQPVKGFTVVLDDTNFTTTGATGAANFNGNVISLHTAFGF